uniref:serine/threonine-protein kinase Nek9 isoform X1 n=2 Tax=Myxine glutinosa TaxID=7769 RepID=UPI00358F99BD
MAERTSEDDAKLDSGRASGVSGDVEEQNYVPVRVLGRGAFGQAMLYRRQGDNSLVVWKDIDLSHLSNKDRTDVQEIDIHAMLHHPNIISYYNHFLNGNHMLIELEYCNGGTLHDKIASMHKQHFEEEKVIWYFYQLASAVKYIHSFDIIHRDIKTLNIFLTKSDLLKLGDFGISKLIETRENAFHSFVGTPHYMSPELIGGYAYNTKIDVWSMGCVLYELLALKKTFDATNALKLCYVIIHGQMDDLGTRYSEALRELLAQCLKKDAEERATAADIMEYDVIKTSLREMEDKVEELNQPERQFRLMNKRVEMLPVVTPCSSDVYYWGGGKYMPQTHLIFNGQEGCSALQVCAGKSHFAAVSVEKELYTWASVQGGTKMVGQLGHGDKASYRSPKCVDSLLGIAIKQVACGDEFTVCLSEQGEVFSFGSNYYGCMGCGGNLNLEFLEPLPVLFENNLSIAQVSCGDCHVVVLAHSGAVFSWGCGEYGRLGLGNECTTFSPEKVMALSRYDVKSVVCGTDGTFFLTHNCRVLACGNNEFNKLGLNQYTFGLLNTGCNTDVEDRDHEEVLMTLEPVLVKQLLRYQIQNISGGKTHSAAFDVYGRLYMFGDNSQGQIGMGHCRKLRGIIRHRGTLVGKIISRLSCGDGFTIAVVDENQVYAWGNVANGRLGMPDCPRTNIISRPRPIFGTIRQVSDLSCRGWHTVLIGECVLSAKHIRPPGNQFSRTSDVENVQVETDTESESGFGGSDKTRFDPPKYEENVRASISTSCPPWLQKEMAEAEFIPLDRNSSNNGNEQRLPPCALGLGGIPKIPNLELGSLADSSASSHHVATDGQSPLSSALPRSASHAPSQGGKVVKLKDSGCKMPKKQACLEKENAELRAEVALLHGQLDSGNEGRTGYITQEEAEGLRRETQLLSTTVRELESQLSSLNVKVNKLIETMGNPDAGYQQRDGLEKLHGCRKCWERDSRAWDDDY